MDTRGKLDPAKIARIKRELLKTDPTNKLLQTITMLELVQQRKQERKKKKAEEKQPDILGADDLISQNELANFGNNNQSNNNPNQDFVIRDDDDEKKDYDVETDDSDLTENIKEAFDYLIEEQFGLSPPAAVRRWKNLPDTQKNELFLQALERGSISDSRIINPLDNVYVKTNTRFFNGLLKLFMSSATDVEKLRASELLSNYDTKEDRSQNNQPRPSHPLQSASQSRQPNQSDSRSAASLRVQPQQPNQRGRTSQTSQQRRRGSTEARSGIMRGNPTL